MQQPVACLMMLLVLPATDSRTWQLLAIFNPIQQSSYSLADAVVAIHPPWGADSHPHFHSREVTGLPDC